MGFKSKTQPFCRQCGKPLRKVTTVAYIKAKPYDERYDRPGSGSRTINVEKLPKTLAECRKLSNQHIVSVKRDRTREYQATGDDIYDQKMTTKVTADRGIDQLTEWDGETYDDEFFCTTTCARAMAYAILKKEPGWGTKAYRDAVSMKK